MADAHDDMKIRISVIGKGDRGHAKNKKVTWAALRRKLANPVVDKKHSDKAYRGLSPDDQLRIKDVGSFCGGPYRDGIRKLHCLKQRSVITLDIDEITPKQVRVFKRGLSEACEYEFFGSTTRKHSRKAPRWRIVFPLTRPLTVEEYAPAARILSSKMLLNESESMDAVDDVSFRPAQIMYWPSMSHDGEFETLHNEGELLDPDELLEDFGDWQDWTALPYSDKRGQKKPNTGQKAEDPREKGGIIGAFCRAYDIESAMDEYLPGVYVPGDEHSNKPRYTYAAGTSSNGAVVEDDGLFLYSHHGSDPAAELLVNSFDLVRIHLFGDLDDEHDDFDSPSELPSFKKMCRLALEDEAVKECMDEDDGYGFYDEPKFSNLDDDEEDEDEEEDDSDSPRETNQSDDPDMSIIAGYRSDAPEFPANALGPFWSAKVEKWANDKSAAVDYAALSLVIGAASLIGNARRVQPRPGWVEPCILWGALVGDPSSKKSPAMDPINDALSEIEKDFLAPYQEELRFWEADKRFAEQKKKIWEARLNDHVESACDESFDQETVDSEASNDFGMMPKDCIVPKKPVRRRTKITDSTLEAMTYNLEGNPRGLLAVHDELSAWYSSFTRYSGSQTSSDRAIWLQAYGGREYKVDRVKHIDDPLVIPSFSVSILGGLQPDRLRDFMKLSDDGLQARFIYSWPDPEFKRMPYSEEDDNSAAQALRRLAELDLEVDKNGKPNPEILKMSKKAWKRFEEWSHNRAIDERFSVGAIQGAYGKADGMVARLALVIEFLWWSGNIFGEKGEPVKISDKAVRAAIRLRENYIKPMQQKVFGYGDTQGSMGDVIRLAGWVLKARPESVRLREITHGNIVPGFHTRNAEAAQEALEALVNLKWLERPEAKKKGRGRPKKVYKVNERVYEICDADTEKLRSM